MTLLITWLWQGAAIALGTAALLGCTRRLSAASRHAIWWIACAAVLCLPAVLILIAALSRVPASSAPVAIPAAPSGLVPAIAIGWLVFAGVGLFRVARSVAAVFRLKRTATPVDVALAWRLDAARPSLPPVRVSDAVPGACALGLGRPVILLSPSLVARLDPDALTAIVLHEHAHLQRRDDWLQLLQAVIRAVAGWHPAVWFIGRRIALEREAACDDHAVGRALGARDYAHALVHAAEFTRAAADRQSAIPCASLSASVLRRRIRRLLDRRIDRATRPTRRTRLVSTTAMLLTIASAAQVPAVVEFVDLGAIVPRVGAPWLRHPIVTLATEPAAEPVFEHSPARPRVERATDAGRLTDISPAVGSPTGAVPVLPIAAGPVAALDGSTAASVHVATPPPAGAAASLVSNTTPAAPWTAIARSAMAGGQRIAGAGSHAGSRAQDAGVSIGRFFSRTGKRVAGGF